MPIDKTISEELDNIFEMMPSEKRFVEEEAENGGYEKIEAYQAIERLIKKVEAQAHKHCIEIVRKHSNHNDKNCVSEILELLKQENNE